MRGRVLVDNLAAALPDHAQRGATLGWPRGRRGKPVNLRASRRPADQRPAAGLDGLAAKAQQVPIASRLAYQSCTST